MIFLFISAPSGNLIRYKNYTHKLGTYPIDPKFTPWNSIDFDLDFAEIFETIVLLSVGRYTKSLKINLR